MSGDDGNDRRVYVGNLPPDIRNKVFFIAYLQITISWIN